MCDEILSTLGYIVDKLYINNKYTHVKYTYISKLSGVKLNYSYF